VKQAIFQSCDAADKRQRHTHFGCVNSTTTEVITYSRLHTIANENNYQYYSVCYLVVMRWSAWY